MKRLKIGLLVLLFSQFLFSSSIAPHVLEILDDSHMYVVLEWETSRDNRIDLDLKMKSPGNLKSKQTLSYLNKNNPLEWGNFLYDHLGDTDKATEVVSEMLAVDLYDASLFDVGKYQFTVSHFSGGGGNSIPVKVKFYFNNKELIDDDFPLNLLITPNSTTGVAVANTAVVTPTLLTLQDTRSYELVIGENRGGEHDDGLGVGRGNDFFELKDKAFGFGEIITTIKEYALINKKKISTLSIGVHGNKLALTLRPPNASSSLLQQFLLYSEEINFSPGEHNFVGVGKAQIINLFVNNNDYTWKTESLYARSRLRSLRKYLSYANSKLPNILIWGCQIGNNIELLKAIALETNAIIHANTQYSGVSTKVIADYTLDVVVCPNGNVSYIEGKIEQCYQ